MRAALFTTSLVVAALAAGCDKTTDPESGSLTAEEARAIALAVDNGTSAAVDQNSSEGELSLSLSPTSPARDVFTNSGTFDVTKECDVSGMADVVGQHSLTIDGDAGTIDFEVTATADLIGCTFLTDDEVEISLDGALDFEAVRHLSNADGGSASGSQTHSGSLDYVTSEGKEGTCPIDLTTEFAASNNSASRTIQGTVCSHTVDVTTTWNRT